MISPRYSLRTKLILGFSVVIILGVSLSAVIGITLIGSTIITQAQEKVRLDLNSAREIYQHQAESIRSAIRINSDRFFLKDAIRQNDRSRLEQELERIRVNEGLDVLTLTGSDGRVLVRARNPGVYSDIPSDELLERVINEKRALVSTQLVPVEELRKEGEELAARARITPISTPRAKIKSTAELTTGMMIRAASPVLDYDGNLTGVLYGGNLLNRNYAIVDEVKDVVYQGARYRDVDIGTTTIFQGDIRISTNVMNNDGTRAIGTRVSEEVYDQVLLEGIPWIGRAFVVNAWYITAYEPIRDLGGDIIGMLYVGMLEAPYVDLKNRVILRMAAIALLSFVLLWIIGRFATRSITTPITELVFATNKVAEGDLSHRVDIRSQDELGLLASSFNKMAAELNRYTEEYKALASSLEKRVEQKTEELKAAQDHLIRTEKLGSLGKLAAGIAHEINNPLTSIMINSELIAEELGDNDQYRESLELITGETARCGKIVKGLLDFSRQSEPEKIPTAVNRLIERIMLITESQALFHNVTVETELEESLPQVLVDPNKIEQVFTNVILNALDAMPDGGTLSISSRISADGRAVEIEFRDTGCGIAEEDLGRVFDPFFTTKDTEGTGLGLSVSYGIMEQHDGTIEIQSTKGKGTTVTICIPLHPDELT